MRRRAPLPPDCDLGSPGAQGLPGGINVSVEVFLGGFARAHAVTRVVIGEDVAVDACAQADVEAAHLAQVHCVAVREENCVPGEAGKHRSEGDGGKRLAPCQKQQRIGSAHWDLGQDRQ